MSAGSSVGAAGMSACADAPIAQGVTLRQIQVTQGSPWLPSDRRDATCTGRWPRRVAATTPCSPPRAPGPWLTAIYLRAIACCRSRGGVRDRASQRSGAGLNGWSSVFDLAKLHEIPCTPLRRIVGVQALALPGVVAHIERRPIAADQIDQIFSTGVAHAVRRAARRQSNEVARAG